jgi:hypothetical protein
MWITRGLVFALVASFTLTIKSSFDDSNAAKFIETKQRNDLIWSQEMITGLTHSLENFKTTTSNNFVETKNSIEMIAQSLRGGGWEEKSIDRVVESYSAKQLKPSIVLRGTNKQRSKTTLKYYPKNVDVDVVTRTLKGLGFNLKTGKPTQQLPTNSIWFGAEVPLDEVKIVALTLIEAGVLIQAIRPFKPSSASRKKFTIEVGSDPEYTSKPAITAKSISENYKFTR